MKIYHNTRSDARQFAAKAGHQVKDCKDQPSVNGHRWATIRRPVVTQISPGSANEVRKVA